MDREELGIIIGIIKEEIDSYQDKNAPERRALARLITKIESEYQRLRLFIARSRKMGCKKCGHWGDMHSDGNHSHMGECYYNLKNGKQCDCKKFVKPESCEQQWK